MEAVDTADPADQIAGLAEKLHRERFRVMAVSEPVRGRRGAWRRVLVFQLNECPTWGWEHWHPVRMLVARGVTVEWLDDLDLDARSDLSAALTAVVHSRLRARHLQGWAELGVRPRNLTTDGQPWTVPVADAALALASAAREVPEGLRLNKLNQTGFWGQVFEQKLVARSRELAVLGLRLGLAPARFGDVARASLAGSPLDLTFSSDAAHEVFVGWLRWWDLLRSDAAGWQHAGFSLSEARALLAFPADDPRRPGPDQLVAMAALRGLDG